MFLKGRRRKLKMCIGCVVMIIGLAWVTSCRTAEPTATLKPQTNTSPPIPAAIPLLPADTPSPTLTATSLPEPSAPPTSLLDDSSDETLEPVAPDLTVACPPVNGVGTIDPAIAIYSMAFVVNGFEQVVRPGDTLRALAGDEVQIKEVIICAGPFSGNGGQACVDFVPVSPSGQELGPEHAGTHMVRVTPGFTTISGPDRVWTVDERWKDIAGVLNHWPSVETKDLDCANGRCERDDRIIVGLLEH